MDRKVSVIEEIDGKKTVFIHDIVFKGRQRIEWNEVEEYLKKYIGEIFTIESSNEKIYIGNDFPEEYAHSNYTVILKGTNAKAKANAVQGLPEIVEIASNPKFEKNRKDKHNKDARYGWYSYESRFAIPVFDENNDIKRYNIFNVALLIRHAENGKKYLYDFMKIKKETSTHFQP